MVGKIVVLSLFFILGFAAVYALIKEVLIQDRNREAKWMVFDNRGNKHGKF